MYKLSSSCQIKDLDQIYTQYFGLFTNNRFFVEVGAYDGESVSNTSGLADAGWRGIYVEPVHHNYLSCLERHKGNDVIVSNLAIGLEEGVQQIYTNGLLSSLDETHAEIGVNKFNYPNYSKDVCFQLRMDTFLKKYDVPYDFDLLVVDVEGREDQVFYSFNLNEWRPKMIIVELVDDHEYFVSDIQIQNRVKELRQFINDSSYREIYRDDINTIFVRYDIV
jgi:FkbM family methyltransferase